MELLVETGESIISGVSIILFNAFNAAIKERKKNKQNKQILKNLNENKIIENKILSFEESSIKSLYSDFDKILSNYNSEKLILALKLLCEKFKNDSEIESKIEKKIKNFKFSKNPNRYNILVLGQNKIALINSIKINEDINDKNIEKNKEFTSYINKEVRLLDFQEIDEINNKKKDLKSVIKFIKESLMNNNSDEFIHCIWYCINGKKFNNSEKENIVQLIKLDEEDSLPLIILHIGIDNGQNEEDIEREIKKVIKGNKQKDNNICQITLENNNSLIEDDEDYIFEEKEIQKLIEISLKKIKLNLNSTCPLKMKLKAEFENEIYQKNSEIETIINIRIKDFLIGNQISNMYLLNKQIINIIINKLFDYQKVEMDDKIKDSIRKSFKDFEELINKKYIEYFDNNFGNNDVFIRKYKNEKKKQNQEQNKEIENELILFFLELSYEKKENFTIKKGGVQERLVDKISNLCLDAIIKKCYYFIDNKINEELAKLLLQSYNRKINNYIQNIYK